MDRKEYRRNENFEKNVQDRNVDLYIMLIYSYQDQMFVYTLYQLKVAFPPTILQYGKYLHRDIVKFMIMVRRGVLKEVDDSVWRDHITLLLEFSVFVFIMLLHTLLVYSTCLTYLFTLPVYPT